MFEYDSLHISLYRILAEEIPDAKNSELLRLANRLGEAAVENMPKHGDFWLNEDDGCIYVNKGWEVVDPFLSTLTPEQRKIRQRKIDATADDLDYTTWLNDNENSDSQTEIQQGEEPSR